MKVKTLETKKNSLQNLISLYETRDKLEEEKVELKAKYIRECNELKTKYSKNEKIEKVELPSKSEAVLKLLVTILSVISTLVWLCIFAVDFAHDDYNYNKLELIIAAVSFIIYLISIRFSIDAFDKYSKNSKAYKEYLKKSDELVAKQAESKIKLNEEIRKLNEETNYATKRIEAEINNNEVALKEEEKKLNFAGYKRTLKLINILDEAIKSKDEKSTWAQLTAKVEE